MVHICSGDAVFFSSRLIFCWYFSKGFTEYICKLLSHKSPLFELVVLVGSKIVILYFDGRRIFYQRNLIYYSLRVRYIFCYILETNHDEILNFCLLRVLAKRNALQLPWYFFSSLSKPFPEYREI